MTRLVAVMMVLAVATSIARADEPKCLDAIEKLGTNGGTVVRAFWTGTKLVFPAGTLPFSDGDRVVYFAAGAPPHASDLGIAAIDPLDFEPDTLPACGASIFAYTITKPESVPTRAPLSVAGLVRSYYAPPTTESFRATGGASGIAAEAVQILGTIVVNRASTAAYALISRKLLRWLGCDAPDLFKATCGAVKNLRLQDLAMAPDQLRAALAADAFAYADFVPKLVALSPSSVPAIAGTPSAMNELRALVLRELIPELGVPVGVLSSHGAEAFVRAMVDRGLKLVYRVSSITDTKTVAGVTAGLEDLENSLDELHLPADVNHQIATRLAAAKRMIATLPDKEAKLEAFIKAEIEKAADTARRAADPAKKALDEAARKGTDAAKKAADDAVQRAEAIARAATGAAEKAADDARAKLQDEIEKITIDLAGLEGQFQDRLLDETYCQLGAKDAVSATVALAFAACSLKSQQDCVIMQKVDVISATCGPEHMSDEQRVVARSIADHLWTAVMAKSASGAADNSARLIAAFGAVFDVACMYASSGATYQCTIDDRPGAISNTTKVAIVRDVVLAAARRDGAALANAMVQVVTRALTDGKDADYAKGMRVLATVASYAATYASGKDADDAHASRTELLESLTEDMTVRTSRGGDTIWSIGGSLRAVIGGRIGRSNNDNPGDTTIWTPLSVPLGFAVDSLWQEKDDERGFHLEIGLLDLGQYVSWEKGPELAEPRLADAFSPSLTFAVSFGWELPIIAGFTAGYTPSFDFGPTGNGKRGALNVGLALGVYVPLFDFN